MAKEKRVGATFSRIAGSTYRCCNCGRMTRNTGVQSIGSETCAECWDLCGIENEVSDGHRTKEEAWPDARRLMAECKKKGGNPQYDYMVEVGQMVTPLQPETLDIKPTFAVLEVGPRTFRVIRCNPAACGSVMVFKVVATYTTFGAAIASLAHKK